MLIVCNGVVLFFFFKQKTAYEMRISDWSSDVCSSDLTQTTNPLAGKDEAPLPGVVVRTFGEERSLIPGFKTVSMRDVIMQPGAKLPEEAVMMNAMLCHITEGELRIVQDGKAFTAQKNYAWTCNKGTKEHAVNDSDAVAVMRILDLKA